MDKKLNSETYLNINSFVGFSGLKFDSKLLPPSFFLWFHSFRSIDDVNYEEEGIDETNALKKIESEFFNSDSFVTQPPSLEGSLFSEVHTNEIKKFERMLEDSDKQNHQLQQRLNETQNLLDKAQSELKNHSTKIEKIFKELNNMNFDESSEEIDPELTHLKQLIKSKISNIDLSGYKIELDNLRTSLNDYETKTKLFEEDHEALSTMLSEFYSNYNQTQEELSLVSEELASLYHHLCLSTSTLHLGLFLTFLSLQ